MEIFSYLCVNNDFSYTEVKIKINTFSVDVLDSNFTVSFILF